MLLKHTILYLPAQFLGPLTQFLSVIVWTHWLSPAEFGVLMLVTVTHELAFAITLSGFTLYAVRHIPDASDAGKRRQFYNTEATMLAISGLVSMVVALVLLYVILDIKPTALMVGATLLFFVTRSVNLHYADRVRADEQFGNYTLLQVLGPVLGFVLGLLFVMYFEATPTAVIAGYALAQLIALTIVLPRAGYSLKFTNPNREMIKGAFSYGGPIMLAAWLAWFSDHGIRFIVKYGIGSGLGWPDVGALGAGSSQRRVYRQSRQCRRFSPCRQEDERGITHGCHGAIIDERGHAVWCFGSNARWYLGDQ